MNESEFNNWIEDEFLTNIHAGSQIKTNSTVPSHYILFENGEGAFMPVKGKILHLNKKKSFENSYSSEYELSYIDILELENINATDKKRFSLTDGVKIKSITNENLKPYEQDLIGNIILSIDNLKVKDIESASKILTNKGENQSIQMEMINKRGEIIRIII